MAKNQTLCNKNAYGCDKRMTEISGNISEITLWKESTIQPKLVEMDNFLTNFAAKFDGIIKNVATFRQLVVCPKICCFVASDIQINLTFSALMEKLYI